MNKIQKAKLRKRAILFDKVLKEHYREYPESKKVIESKTIYYEILTDLRKKRKEMGLTLEKVERLSGVPKATISKIESGKRNVTIDTLVSIAKSMGKNLEITLK